MPLGFSSRRNFIKRIFYTFAAVLGYRALPSVADEGQEIQIAQGKKYGKKGGKKKPPIKKKKAAKKSVG